MLFSVRLCGLTTDLSKSVRDLAFYLLSNPCEIGQGFDAVSGNFAKW